MPDKIDVRHSVISSVMESLPRGEGYYSCYLVASALGSPTPPSVELLIEAIDEVLLGQEEELEEARDEARQDTRDELEPLVERLLRHHGFTDADINGNDWGQLVDEVVEGDDSGVPPTSAARRRQMHASVARAVWRALGEPRFRQVVHDNWNPSDGRLDRVAQALVHGVRFSAGDPWDDAQVDAAERDAIAHEPASVWTRLRHPAV